MPVSLFGGASCDGLEENLAEFARASGFALGHGADRVQEFGG
jgi:hypothetical protein